MSWFRHDRWASTAPPIRSLSWRGDQLVDWVSGGSHWEPSGRFVAASRSWGYGRLDGAIVDATGRWALVHERLGTPAILLRDGEPVREIHRSIYHANAFLFPACLFEGPDGRMLLAHCPQSPAGIEIDDAESGRRLTAAESRSHADIFHSRLAVSPNTKRLMSAGWVWHPLDTVVFFDIATALCEPAHLDRPESALRSQDFLTEESSAAWLDDDHVVLGGSDMCEDRDEELRTRDDPEPRLRPNGLAVYDLARERCLASMQLGHPPGTMMPVGLDHLVTFFGHPKLVCLATRRVVHEWPDVAGEPTIARSILPPLVPFLALDAARARFAVGSSDAIDIVTMDATSLPR